MIVMGFVQTWAQDNAPVTVTPPTITPGSCEYNGTIMPVITADEGCSIVYVKSTSKLYTTVEDIDKNQGVKTENSNKATITDIINKTGNRYISAYATKDVNGQTYKSAVTTVTYTYNKDANTKTDITLSASSIKLDMANPTATQNLNIIAKDAKGNTIISGLTYSFTVYPEGIVTVASDGTVTPKAAGTASINVIFEGNDNYNAATCVVDVNVTSNAIGRVFYSIADIRHATQSSTDKSKKNANCVLIFTENNPATVIAVMKNPDSNYEDSKFIGSYFIIDNSNRGLWIRANDIYPSTNLKIGSKITGTYLASYTQNDKMVPSLYEFSKKDRVIDGNTYKYEFNIDHSGEANGDKPATYPYTAVEDVNTISKNNDENGDIVQASYGVYQNSIVSVPGIIRLGAGGEYYLVQDENSGWDEKNNDKRLIINTQQIGVNLADYVNTVGTFEGILIKRGINYAQLIVLKNNFYQINKIYLDENDDEKRIDDLVNAGAFDDEVDVYVHRTKLVNSTDTWGTLCFPFDLTKEEFKTAFGCDLTALAAPKCDGEQQDHGRLTKIGTVNDNNLVFEKVSDLNITEGMPYLFKATGKQTACERTDIKYTITDKDGTRVKTPQDLIKEDESYYAHIGQKTITVVPPHQIKGNINNNVVNGDFYFRGLYGSKQYTEDDNGKLTTTPVSDNGTQKYQYISTGTGNYLKYLKSGATAKFPGLRAYFYFPKWNAVENNKLQPSNNTSNSKVFLFVEDSTTGISDIRTDESHNDGRIYNLAGQVVDESYKGIVIKNGRKYLAK